jgi:hypothetical protein
MSYGYDLFGWYVGVTDGARRSTDIEPENKTLSAEPGAMRANWTGHKWVDMPYVYHEYNPAPASAVTNDMISPIDLKLMFTTAERIGIRAARKTDVAVDDAFDFLDDPRLKEIDVNSEMILNAINYMTSIGLIGLDRRDEIFLELGISIQA